MYAASLLTRPADRFDRSRRADEHPRPWIRTKPTTLQKDMKSIILDFQKRSELSGIKGRIHAGIPTEMHQSDHWSANRHPLNYSDQMLARDIVITDMQARINQLKRSLSAEQYRFDRELCDVRAKLKDLKDRDIELGAQNAFLRQAILDGRMGDQFDTHVFEELYNELVSVDKEEDSVDEELDYDNESLSPLAYSSRPPSKTLSTSLPRTHDGTTHSLHKKSSAVCKADSFIQRMVSMKNAREVIESHQDANSNLSRAASENQMQVYVYAPLLTRSTSMP